MVNGDLVEMLRDVRLMIEADNARKGELLKQIGAPE